MRRSATGCARVVSRRVSLAAVSSQFWKTVHLACAASSGDSALFIMWYSFNSNEDGRETVYIFYYIWPYTYGVEGYTSPKKHLGACNISQTASTRGVP